jgi:hypothetical protein
VLVQPVAAGCNISKARLELGPIFGRERRLLAAAERLRRVELDAAGAKLLPAPVGIFAVTLGARSSGRECQQGQERNRADLTPIGHHAASSCYRVTSDDSGKPTVRCDTSSARPSRKLI